MIFYFSATGNSKYVAQRISEETRETMISIPECISEQQFTFEMEDNERVGFVTPTYFWGLPTIVNDFLEKMELREKGNNYFFHVATYGTTTGQAARMMEKRLKEKELTLNGKFSVRMVDTWTPTFDLTDQDKIRTQNEQADKIIEKVLYQVKNRENGDFTQNKVPMMAVHMFYQTYEKKRKTKNFSVEVTCIGCGLCAQKCPVGAIEMLEGKPVWVKSECTLCLGCLHRCPKFAIQYGKNTKKHGQFTNPNVKL